MAKEYAKTFYSSTRWKKCRAAYISDRILVDGGICEACGKQLGYIVHHKTMLDESNINNPEITLSLSNLMYVCKDCHDQFEGHLPNRCYGKDNCIFDEAGQPISVREIDTE